MNDKPPPPKTKHRPWIVLLLGAILVGLFLTGYIPRLQKEKALERETEELILPEVTVMEISPDTKNIKLILPSSTQALRITPLWARTNGYLGKLLVDIGDDVKEGQLLANIETPEVEEQYDQAKADYESSIARHEIAKISAQRWFDLYESNPEALSAQEVDERRTTLQASEADLQSYKANMMRLEKLLEFKKIIAPFNGKIIERNVDIGSLITQGSNGNPQQLFVLAQNDIMRVFVNVPQTFYRQIKNGVETDVKIREFPDRIFKGTVARFSGAVDPVARTMLTEIHVDNKEGLLLPGLYAEVKFSLKPDNAYFVIPTDALIIRTGNPQIAVLDKDNIAHLTTVNIGLDYGLNVEVIDGLKNGDKIITNPSEKILEGTKVNVIGTSKLRE